MTFTDDMKLAAEQAKAAAITLPDDTSKSRLSKPASKTEPLDDVATAGERIEAFWEKYPDGSILTEVEASDNPAGLVTIYTVRAFIRKNGDADRPDSTAHATRSTADPDAVTAQFPQETAETSAISRALRNLGILATRKPSVAPEPAAPTPAEPAVSPVAVARRAAGMSQTELAKAMRGRGLPWTQVIVSKIERGKRAVTPDESTALAALTPYAEP